MKRSKSNPKAPNPTGLEKILKSREDDAAGKANLKFLGETMRRIADLHDEGNKAGIFSLVDRERDHIEAVLEELGHF